MPGDLVSSAPPKANPVSIARSNLSSLKVSKAKFNVHIPNIDSIESTKARESKNTANGEMA